MGLYLGDTRGAPVIMATPIYRGSYNIVTDLGLTVGALVADIITALASEISTSQYANYCFVDIPYANYSVVSGYDQFTTTSDYVGYYVLVGDVYTLVTADNKDTLGIVVGTTVAYSVSYTSYFEKIQRYRYNGNSWEYEYDVDFSGYANVDASNFTDSGTTFLSGLGMPSNRYETLTVGASGSTYTAPANGYVFCEYTTTSSWGYVYIDNIDNNNNRYFGNASIRNYNGITYLCINIPIKKNNIFRVGYNTNTTTISKFYFIYAEGTPTPPPQP
jgi:hypothetical protein